jgi:hypothetical protein
VIAKGFKAVVISTKLQKKEEAKQEAPKLIPEVSEVMTISS